MNPTVLRLIISIIATLAVYFAIQFTTDSGLGPAASVIATFIIITVALFIGANGKTASPGPKRQSNTSKPSSGASSADQETGSVKWFNVKKGYGFITRDSGDDVFVHYRNIIGSGRRAISDGQRVQFIVIDGDKGLQADEVEAI